jgi:hypothetical protein
MTQGPTSTTGGLTSLDISGLRRIRQRDLFKLLIRSNSTDEDLDALQCCDDIFLWPLEIERSDFDATILESYIARLRQGCGTNKRNDILATCQDLSNGLGQSWW